MINNPWMKLQCNKMIRINEESIFDIYWIKHVDSNYGLLFKIKNAFTKIQNIETKELRTYSSQDDFLIYLNDSNNWEIFKIFCDDLINTVNSSLNKDLLFNKLENRINEWKELLARKEKNILSIQEQMGLFSELVTLKDIILSNNKSISYWTGSDGDNHDFLCSNCAIEVKSTLSSKKKNITISSKHQLKTEKNNLFIIFYLLTENETGIKLTTLVKTIINSLFNEEDKIIFMKKLLNIGYSFKEKNYFSFLIDLKECYHITDNFPKLNPINIDSRIIEIKYKIDLNLCQEFIINENKIMGDL